MMVMKAPWHTPKSMLHRYPALTYWVESMPSQPSWSLESTALFVTTLRDELHARIWRPGTVCSRTPYSLLLQAQALKTSHVQRIRKLVRGTAGDCILPADNICAFSAPTMLLDILVHEFSSGAPRDRRAEGSRDCVQPTALQPAHPGNSFQSRTRCR